MTDLFSDEMISIGDDAPRLHVRRYAGGEKTPALCIHGLTRNLLDFEELAPKIAMTGRDVYAVSLRGRGLSGYDPEITHYFPTVYRDDMISLLDNYDLPAAIFVGTSLGGITTMLVNEAAPERVAAAIINDVGPALADEGLARIGGYVGKSAGPAPSIAEAAQRIRAINEVAFPDADDAEWEKFARRTFRETPEGWVLDYDPQIAAALATSGPAPDLWAAWKSLANTPTLLVHGGISDLLTDPIVDSMREARPGFDYVRVPRIGHAPMMTEPAAWSAVSKFLKTLP